MAKKERQRATSIYNFLNKKIERLEFTGEWEKTFGRPPKVGIWYICGYPGSGKTSFICMFMKALSDLGMRTRFYNFEEGDDSPTLQDTVRRVGISENESNIQVISDLMPFEEMKEELLNPNLRVNALIIDSRKEAGLTSINIKEIKKIARERGLLIAIICHVAPNGSPEQTADWDVWRAAKMRVTIDRLRAINIGRTFGVRSYFDIWKERADVLWAENV